MSITRRDLLSLAPAALLAKDGSRLRGSTRGTKNGWISVRLEGSPADIGYQHGYQLSAEIDDAVKVSKLELEHSTSRPWSFFRDAAQAILWPGVDEEYRDEMKGIAEGAAARGTKLDLWDIVVHNANIEFGYYVATLDKNKKPAAPDRCSAFVATGSATRDGKVVIAHNNWSGYLEGARWNIMFDIRPAKGYRFLMDGVAGLIHSGDDFGVNSAGIVITETTITQFSGFDTKGKPEFVRARKAMQYGKNIDEFVAIMRDGNNGGYANSWLVADINANEIARLELGLKNVTLDRKTDGAFTGANFPINPKLIAEETEFPVNDLSVSANARRVRWDQLMQEYKGKIDLEAAKRFLSDHYDTFDKKDNSPSERTLCGHIDLSPRGLSPWQDAWGPAGAVQAKATDATLARRMTLEASMGHSCGIDFRAAEFLARHKDFAWQRPLLKDLPSHPWARFESGI